MSERLPAVKPSEVLRALERDGWQIHRQRGSHVILRKEGHSYVLSVPMHRRDMPKGTLRGIIEDAGLTVEEFLALLR